MSRYLRELADPAHPYHHAPRNRWLIAGTPLREAYPCRCHGTRGCTRACPCRGRTDHLDQMSQRCCARRAAETAARTSDREATDD